jgi:hypothetical protein
VAASACRTELRGWTSTTYYHISLLDCFMHTWAAPQAYNQNLDLLVDLNSAGSMEDRASSFLCLMLHAVIISTSLCTVPLTNKLEIVLLLLLPLVIVRIACIHTHVYTCMARLASCRVQSSE